MAVPLKRCDTEAHVTTTMKHVASGEQALSPTEELIRLLISQALRRPGLESSQLDDFNAEIVMLDIDVDGSRYLLIRMPVVDRRRVQLSPREQEIVRMVAQGQCNKIIADVLNISSWTVCTHLRRIFAKLGVNSRAAMVARLNETGGLSRRQVLPGE